MNKYSTINQPRRSWRQAFTLVELLLVVSIIAVIASLGVGVMAQAQNDAAIAATRSRMSLIQNILEIELEDYEVRRSPIPFDNIGALITASTLDNTGGAKTLLHAKNLKRMFIADLIRAEMPDGSVSGPAFGVYPTGTLRAYLAEIGIPDPHLDLDGDGDLEFPLPAPFPVTRWIERRDSSGTLVPYAVAIDSQIGDGIDEAAADKAELLYDILAGIDIDGVPAIEQLGSQAIGDTDGDTFLEVIDAWGEPLYLQWQQELMTLEGATPTTPFVTVNDNEWVSGAGMAGLSLEHPDPAFTAAFPPATYSVPVLPTQIRPFLISERLLKVDGGLPADYLTTAPTDHSF